MQTLIITEIIGSPNAIIQKQGLQVFEEVKKHLQNKKLVTLSFKGLQNVTSGFCNASVGNIYRHYPELADELLSLEDTQSIAMLDKKIKTAIQLGKNPEKARAINQALSDLLAE